MQRRSAQLRKQPDQERARATMNAIVVAGARVLACEGLERASTTRIAEVAGVSVGSLYQYFANREEIIGAIIDRSSEDMLVAFHSLAGGLANLELEPMVRGAVFGLYAVSREQAKLHAPLYDQMSATRRTHRLDCMLEAYVGVVATILKNRTDVAVCDPWVAARLIVHGSDGVIRSLVVSEDIEQAHLVLDEAVRMITRYLTRSAGRASSADS
jgi:AcrR family transcriptional regulator